MQYHRNHQQELEQAADELVRKRASEGRQAEIAGAAFIATTQDTDMAGEPGQEDVRGEDTVPRMDESGATRVQSQDSHPEQPADTRSSPSPAQYLPATTFTARASEALSRARPSTLASVTPVSSQQPETPRIKTEVLEARLDLLGPLGPGQPEILSSGIEGSTGTAPVLAPPMDVRDASSPPVKAEELPEPSLLPMSPAVVLESPPNPRKRPAEPHTPAPADDPPIRTAPTSDDAETSPTRASLGGDTGGKSFSVKRIRLRLRGSPVPSTGPIALTMAK